MFSCVSIPKGATAVKPFGKSKYLGKWYEIARFDYRFEKNMNSVFRGPLMSMIRSEDFLSRLCNQTFGQYAYAQIKKAKGLNKKIVNPISKEIKTVIGFCYVIQGQASIPLRNG